jgi:hypothetical protein
VTAWQIGKHGGTLVPLRNPAAPTHELVLIGGQQVSLAGAQTQQTLAKKYSVTWEWENIPDADYQTIAQWWDGTQGNGPFDIIDPLIRPTLITVNISSLAPNPVLYQGLWSPEMVMAEV